MVVRVPRIWSVSLAAILASAAGCSSDSGDDDGDLGTDDQADDGTDGADDAPDDGTTDDGADDDGGDSTVDGEFTVEWGPVMVPHGVEDTRCIRKRLTNDTEIKVGQIENRLGLSSHHLIVYRLADDIEETTEPEPCQPFVEVLDPTKGSPMAVTQRSEELISLPPGVAFSLEAGQMIRMELHYINATDEDRELTATTTFHELPESEFEQEADFLFIGNPDINLPPAPAEPEEPDVITLGPSYLPLPSDLADINVFAITGHEHQWGTDVQVSVATGEDDEGTPIYAPEDFQWDEPETTYHDPPISMPAGGGFQFTCSWQNRSDQEVGFGESVNDEMCFFWAYYYPSHGAKICFHTEQFGGQDLCCPDNPLCEYIDDFLNQ
ncbi:MAG TPA: hypothetical protein VK698_29285 [Kofleriaceae bacterium]|nr:hypothetical protein [Kofleriaceae bacterium]